MDDFYVGLDVGTSSVGWCVTDSDYNLARIKGKTAWGSYIFPEAEDCKERRQYRSSKRRINRRKYRIYLLNLLFSEEISKIDSTFFLRLSSSSFCKEDKDELIQSDHLLFKDKEKESKFYKTYPTIWHLRKALIENDENALNDIRNLYLAIHHIIKYRGNFLKEGVAFNCESFDYSILNDLNDAFKNLYSECEGMEFDGDIVLKSFKDNFENIYLTEKLGKKEKQTAIKACFEKTTLSKYVELFSSLSTGGKYSLSKLFDEEIDIKEVQFNKEYDENINVLKELFGESFKIIEIAKEINDFVIIRRLIGKNACLSESMVQIYLEHKSDLKMLKNIVINIDKRNGVNEDKDRLYYHVFKDKKSSQNYAYFVKQTQNSDPSIEIFNKFVVTDVLEKYKDYINQQDYEYILDKCVKNSFLTKISIASTSTIPHQLHLNELKIILNNAEKKYPWITNIQDKIIKLFLYKIPYYYGPLDTRSEYSNVVRKSNVTITPWNISDSDIIDETQTRIKFMNRLINNCQYISGAKVIAKSSLTYEDFMLYDKINNLYVNGSKLESNEKVELYNYVTHRNKTNLKQVKQFFSKRYETNENDVSLAGLSDDACLIGSSHNYLSKAFNLETELDSVDEYIKLATIYADDKRMLKNILYNEHKELNDQQRKALLNLPTSKWASVSREFLTTKFYIDDNGETFSIIDLMKIKSDNFQQIYWNKTYKFQENIKTYNLQLRGNEKVCDQINEILEKTPSLTRRSIIKTISVLEDIEKASNKQPSKIFIEVTRENDEIKKGKSQISRIKETENFLNKALKCELEDHYKARIKELEGELKRQEIVDGKIKSKHVYLYFKQLGFDLYTGKKISLEDVLNSDLYDLDHIIPQSLIKDDSLDNLALVEKNQNEKVKKDAYPLPESICNKENRKLWAFLHNCNSISDKKYNNLIRRTEISVEELEGFVNRQINVVNYSNIALRDILQIKYPNSTVVFSKAQYPHILREEYSIVKNRDLNDTHHAVDAYLNIVSGNILSNTFSNVRERYKEKHAGNERSFNMERVLLELASNYKEKIINNSLRHDVLVTYGCEYIDGAMYKQTIYPHNGDKNKLIPIHTDSNNPMSNIEKYGGYDQLVTSFLIPVSFNEGKKSFKKLVGYKLLDLKLYGKSTEDIKKIIINKYLKPEATNVTVGKPIYFNQKIIYKHGIYCLYTKGDVLNLKNAYQSYLNNDYLLYLKSANKYCDRIKEDVEEIKIFTDLKQKKYVQLSKSMNATLLDYFILLASNERFDDCNYIVSFRDTDKKLFKNLDIRNQVLCLNEIVKLFSKNARDSKYKSFFGMNGDNIYTVSPNIENCNFSVIYESPTGLFKRVAKI